MARDEGGLVRVIALLLGAKCLGFIAGVAHEQAAGPYQRYFSDNTFPIGVWLQQPGHATRYRELGINLYVGLWKGPTAEQLATLRRAAMPVICEQNEIGLMSPDRDIIVGWQQVDEPDNAQPLFGRIGLGRAGWGSPIQPAEMMRRYQAMRIRDSTRPVFMSMGKGVAWDAWKGRGNRTGHPEDYAEYVKAADIVSFDIYPAAERDAVLAGRLDVVAQGVRRLVEWAGPGKTVWNVIGASRVKNPDATVDPQKIRAQVWMSIISGSRGIVYFVHQFKPRFVEASWFEDPRLAEAIRKINAQVQGMARIINSPATHDVANVTVRNMRGKGHARDVAITSRRSGCSIYVFATSLVDMPLEVEVQLHDFNAVNNVDVLDEGRSIKVKGGRFRDEYPPYGVRLYEAATSKSCGASGS